MAASRKILLAHVFEPQFICLELIVGEEVQERPAKNVCSGEIRPVQSTFRSVVSLAVTVL